ncbi:MAG: zinc ribbon domain-containing protein, partial [Ktedonobacteraceae bacterium]|nr:zinc ribbon domain-containing protein [Ktedonobacteraceae bacterium]
MDARFYNSEDIDIERLAKDLVNAYISQGYQAQDIGNKDQMMVQIKKGGDFEAIIGMQAALSVNLQRTTGGVVATIGQQRWIDKAAVGAVGVVALPFLWPLALTAGVGALRQASLGNQALNMVDGLVRQQKPGIAVGPVPYNLMPQMQQPPEQPPYYTPPAPSAPPRPAPAPMPMPGGLRCTSCNTPYEPGDTFCSGCGRPLAQPHQYCSKCNSEIKPGASFCPRCGSSTFHTVMSPPAPTPAAPSAPKVTYTPPAPAPSTYTPPSQNPSTPVYTPPPQKPPTPVYVPS